MKRKILKKFLLFICFFVLIFSLTGCTLKVTLFGEEKRYNIDKIDGKFKINEVIDEEHNYSYNENILETNTYEEINKEDFIDYIKIDEIKKYISSINEELVIFEFDREIEYLIDENENNLCLDSSINYFNFNGTSGTFLKENNFIICPTNNGEIYVFKIIDKDSLVFMNDLSTNNQLNVFKVDSSSYLEDGTKFVRKWFIQVRAEKRVNEIKDYIEKNDNDIFKVYFKEDGVFILDNVKNAPNPYLLLRTDETKKEDKNSYNYFDFYFFGEITCGNYIKVNNYIICPCKYCGAVYTFKLLDENTISLVKELSDELIQDDISNENYDNSYLIQDINTFSRQKESYK